jgi:predicted AAA+ superfamily ATPase
MKEKDLSNIDAQTIADLNTMNPWWKGNAMEQLPKTRRHLVGQIQRRLQYKLAPIIVVRGSRQIGKTTACLHVIEDLLAANVLPQQIFRVQFDDIDALRIAREPVLQLVRWYEEHILQDTLNNNAAKGQPCYLFFDEIQNLEDWSTQLKFLVDHSTVQIVVTGSSALRIEQGRDSLAGRINTLEVGTLSLTEIGLIRQLAATPPPFLPDNGVSILKPKEFWLNLKSYGQQNALFADMAFKFFSNRGAYPLAHLHPNAPVSDQLNETAIKEVINELFNISSLAVSHLPAREKEPEVDFVLTIGDQRIPVEIKYRNTIKEEHLRGLKWFIEKPINRAPFGILVTKNEFNIDFDDRIVAIPLKHLMLLR